MPLIGIVTGLADEADGLGLRDAAGAARVLCAGADSRRAEQAARRLLADGCAALISFGVAGGLDPALEPGTVIVAPSVIAPDGARFALDGDWRDRLIADLSGVVAVAARDVAGRDRPVVGVAEKRALHVTTGAGAVDMESHAVARSAAAAGARCLVLRAVADPSWRSLPAWLPSAVGEDGRTRPGRVVIGLARRPWSLAAVVRAGGDYRQALAALSRVALHAGPLFQFDA